MPTSSPSPSSTNAASLSASSFRTPRKTDGSNSNNTPNSSSIMGRRQDKNTNPMQARDFVSTMAVAGRRRPRSASFPSLSSSAAVAEASASSQQQQPGNRRTAQRRTSGLSSSNRASKRRLEQLFYGQVGWLALPWWGATTTRVLDWTELDPTVQQLVVDRGTSRLDSTRLDFSGLLSAFATELLRT